MEFADIHFHALFGCDDGPKSEEQMIAMVDQAYRSGTRLMCMTPHFHPAFCGDNRVSSLHAFERLSKHAIKAWPGLKLFLGNELRWDNAAVQWLKDGHCRTMDETRYVLMDFRENEALETIQKGLNQLLSAGYLPILAHVERYRALFTRGDLVRAFRANGVLIQMDAGSVLGHYGLMAKTGSKRMLKARLIDLVCSDAHDEQERSPELNRAYEYVSSKYSHDYADRIFYHNAIALFCGE